MIESIFEHRGIKRAICRIIIFIFIVGCIALIAFKFVKYTTYSETLTGTLSEIEDGVYIQTYNVYSNIPANNTSVAVVCINDQILTINGSINILVTDDTPSYIYTKTNIINGDKLTVYVPRGTIQRLPSANSSSR